MLYNKSIKLLYPIISSYSLFLLMYDLLIDHLYYPVIILILPLPLAVLTVLLSSGYIKENLSEFEFTERVLSGFFLVLFILTSIVISILLVEMKLLLFVICIPMVVLGILTYQISAINIVKDYCDHCHSSLFHKHLRDTQYFILAISSFKTLMFLILKMSGLDISENVLVLLIIGFVADIALIYLVRTQLYILNSRATFNRSIKSSLFTILLITLLSLLISPSDSLLPYTKIVDYLNDLSKYSQGYVYDREDIDEENNENLFENLKHMIQEDPGRYEVNPVLSLLWKSLEYVVFIAGSIALIIIFVVPFISPLINNLKKGVKFSLRDYLNEVLNIFKLFFTKPKEIISNKVNKLSIKDKNKSNQKTLIKQKKFPKGVLKYYYKLLKLLEKREHRKYKHGLTVEELIDKYKADSRLKVLFHEEFYSGRYLDKNEITELKKISKTLLKGK